MKIICRIESERSHFLLQNRLRLFWAVFLGSAWGEVGGRRDGVFFCLFRFWEDLKAHLHPRRLYLQVISQNPVGQGYSSLRLQTLLPSFSCSRCTRCYVLANMTNPWKCKKLWSGSVHIGGGCWFFILHPCWLESDSMAGAWAVILFWEAAC